MEREQAAAEMPGVRVGVDNLGKYRVIAELARGGMGVVHLALQRRPGASTRLLVLKELNPELLKEPAVLAMFMQEARLAARLSHPNIVRTFEAGSDGARRYIAMEYLEGQPLHRVLARARMTGIQVPVEFQGAVICAALEGLAYAHAAQDGEGAPMGIVHRDMSPHNVFVCYDGQVKVLDFGIAKIIDSSVETRAGILKGKVPYMSPEQAAGTQVDARADVFAVGVMLWEAATGRRFWSGVGNDGEILRAMAQGTLSAEHDGAMDGVHEELRAVILRATALDPSMRHPSAGELLTDLRGALAQRRSPALGKQEVGHFVAELFATDRAQLQAVMNEALRSQTQMASGSYLVSDARSRPLADPLDAASLMADVLPTAPPDLAVATSAQRPPSAAPAPEAVRQALLASSHEIGIAVGRLQESERLAALPQSLEVVVRAVHAVGGHDVASSLEALSDCMDVVQSIEQWRVTVSDYLRSLEPVDSVTELIDFEPVEAESARTSAASSTRAPAAVDPRAAVAAVEAPTPSETVPPPLVGRTPRLVAWAFLGALAVLGMTAWMLGLGRAPDPPRASPSAGTGVPALFSAPPPADKPPTERVHVIVRASPAHARIIIDGTLVYENPSVVTLSKEGATHTMHVEADGYVPRDEAFDANGDRTFVLALEPNKTPPRSVAGPHFVAPPPAPPPPPGISNGGAGVSTADKCYFSRQEKAHASPTGSVDDARSPGHAGPPANAHE